MRERTAEQSALCAGLHPLFGVLNEEHAEQDGFPWQKWRALAGTGLLGLPLPERFGGLGQDLETTMHVLETLGEGCRDAGLSFAVTTHMVSTGVTLARFGTEALCARHLPGVCAGTVVGAHAISEPEHGSDSLGMRTHAIRDGSEWVLTGTKQFVSNGPIADVVVVYARTNNRGGALGTTAFLVERGAPGLSFGAPEQTMGLRTAALGGLQLDGVRVPADHVVGRVNGGFLVMDHVLTWEILCSFVVNAGEMRHRVDRCLERARTRNQFGSPIGSYQAVSHRLVDMEVDLRTARHWLYNTAARFASGRHVTTELAIAKLKTSEANVSSALAAVQIFGGEGYLTSTGIEQGLRDAVGSTIYSGTSEIQRNRIASMMGLK